MFIILAKGAEFKRKPRVCEVAQQVKMPDGKLGTLCSIPVSHPVERELLPFVL